MRHYSATIMYIVLISFRVLLHWPFSTLLLASMDLSRSSAVAAPGPVLEALVLFVARG